MTWGIKCVHPKSWEMKPVWHIPRNEHGDHWAHTPTFHFQSEVEAQAFLKNLEVHPSLTLSILEGVTMASRFGEHKKTNESRRDSNGNLIDSHSDTKFEGIERPKEIKALFYWNFLEDDYDQEEVSILIKPIEAFTPLPEDLPTGFYPDGDGYKFGGERAWATEMLDRDKRFIYNTEIGGMKVEGFSL